MVQTYKTAEEAARASNWTKSISSARRIHTPRGDYQVNIVYERGRYIYVYAGALSHVLPDAIAKPSTGEIDAERSWRPW
jgi:hypothetical protein